MLVGDSAIPREALESLELVMASSSLLLNLINNLLDFRKCNANSKLPTRNLLLGWINLLILLYPLFG